MDHADLVLAGRVAVGFAVAFVFGFERQLRGSPAGDRTFALVGAGATAVTAVAGVKSPQAVAGILTGLGFLGGGIIFNRGELVKGLTTAASLFAVASIGIVIGYGHALLGVAIAAVLLLLLEIQHIPLLKAFDAFNWSPRFANDRVFNAAEPAPPPASGAAAGEPPA